PCSPFLPLRLCAFAFLFFAPRRIPLFSLPSFASLRLCVSFFRAMPHSPVFLPSLCVSAPLRFIFSLSGVCAHGRTREPALSAPDFLRRTRQFRLERAGLLVYGYDTD
ncbi:MAG: hypothetical protein LBW77_06080, partial [Verrucomicrobiota bacterium]|nr:hypothetical protein [Verrucomicrobiota bacterium]